MGLLERDQFIRDLTHALNEVEAGNGRTVLVSGEAGIGKTALVRQFIDSYRKKARILWGACEALFTPRPLGPLYDIAHQTPGDFSEVLSTQGSRAAIFAALFNELQRSAPFGIMVIEDVHWADEATLDAIKFLGRRIDQLPSLLIITYRDDELGNEHPLRFVLGDLPRDTVIRLRLPPLSEEAVTRLAVQQNRSIAGLYAATGGNPFFVTEVLASAGQAVPVTIRDAVLARASRLSSGARAVLHLASVVPAQFERWLLEAILPLESALLDECIDSGMLRLENAHLGFRHELARMAVEDSLSPAQRQRLHAQVLDVLTRQNTHPVALSRLAHHATHAADRDAVVRFGPAAAKEAASLGAHREAASQYAVALGYADQLGAETHAELLEDYAYECYLTDRIGTAVQARLTALEIWEQLARQDKQGPNLRWLSRLSWFMGKKVDADLYAIRAIEVLEKLPPNSELAMAYSNRAQLHMLANEDSDAVQWGQRAVEMAVRLGDQEILAHALNNVGAALMHTGDSSGRARLEESLKISLANGLEEHAARAYTNLACRFVDSRAYATAIQYLNDGIHYCLERDLDSWTLYMTAWRARYHFEQGQWQEATDDAYMVVSRPQVSTVARIRALNILAWVRVRRGDPGALDLLDEVRNLAMPTREPQSILPTVFARAEAAWLRGNPAQCALETRVGVEASTSRANQWQSDEIRYWLWRSGDLNDLPQDMKTPFALQIAGNWQTAADAWEQLCCPYEQAMALADGDETAQRAALEIMVRLGAGPASDLVRQKLRAKGVRGIPRGPRPTTKSNPAGLTPRQLEVLTLMSEGLQNAEIASRLSTSQKTIDHHVSAVLAKFNARSRAEAVIAAYQQGIIAQHRRSLERK